MACALLPLLAGGVRASLPFTLDDHVDLRPGAPILPDSWLRVQTLHGHTRELGCTANFLFADDAGNRYLATAGHCAPVERGVHAWAYPEGPVATDMAYRPIGRFVYAGSTMEPTQVPVPLVGFAPRLDMALVRLDEGVEASPRMAHFGGPVGLNADLTQLPVVLHMYGWGVHGANFEDVVGVATAVEQPVHGRTFAAASMPYPDVVHMTGVSGGGDSGSPVISADGRAVGIMSAMNYADHRASAEGVSAGPDAIVRLGPQVAAAEAALGVRLTLLTAPLGDA